MATNEGEFRQHVFSLVITLVAEQSSMIALMSFENSTERAGIVIESFFRVYGIYLGVAHDQIELFVSFVMFISVLHNITIC